MRRPNVVVLFTDQQRWDTIGAAGNEFIHTPNLDKLVGRGVFFDHTFCNNPVCMPSRQSMLSGQYPSAIGCCTNGIEMPEDVPHLATVLGSYGYHTANIGKLHFLNHSNRDHREIHPRYGFDTLVIADEPGCYEDAYMKWVEEKCGGDMETVERCRVSTPPISEMRKIEKQSRAVDEPYVYEGPEDLTHSAFVAEQSVEFIGRHREEPFFLICGFYGPHTPLNPPQRFVDMYDPDKLPSPIMNEGENVKGHSDAHWRKVKQYYYALISHVDDQIGRVLEAIETNGIAEDTLILFVSDHGEHLGDHGRVQKGPPGLDSCSRVPLIVVPPRFEGGGQISQEIVELVDVAPTVLDYCGVQKPPVMQGRSVRPIVEAREFEGRRSAYLEWREPFKDSWKTVRTKSAKYCVCNNGTELLFDLEKDPRELKDVAGQEAYRGLLADMREEMLRRWFDVERQYPRKTGMY